MEPTKKANRWARATAWLQQHGGFVWDKFLQWLGFGAGLVLGIVLALLVYATLQPRIAVQVGIQEAALRKATREKATQDSLAALQAVASAPGPAAAAAGKNAEEETTAKEKKVNKADTASAPASGRPTRLAGLATVAPPDARRAGPELLALLAVAAVVVATGAAWQQKRRKPQLAGTISSPVLEALFTLPAHQQFLQKRLALSPRQIKRFSSKARIQHVQLQAATKPAEHAPGVSTPGVPFPVTHQIKAFQLLLLLEEDRNAPQSQPATAADAFSSRFQGIYQADADLRTAWDQAWAHPVVAAAGGGYPHPPFDLHPDPQLLRQLFELNAGLLA